ncbi:Transcription factor lepE [Lachnellula suecica]|uniref:Transcription factor lepE n=1 Tax=Lachnellula suecica TaxID=602035 RepID=A0A8T9CG69_9HELO|nr:Transcription factor lepE [Lachnellula suecica]
MNDAPTAEATVPGTPTSSISSNYRGNQQDQNIVQTLVDRVQKLEGLLSATSVTDQINSTGPGGKSDFKVDNKQASDEVNSLIDQCKVIARTVKATNAPQSPSWMFDLKETMPSRELSDELVRLYLRTYESTCRIVHIPSFWKEYDQYWSSPNSANQGSLFKILLAMALGICFYQGSEQRELRNKAQQWVYAAQSWLAMPNEKSRLNVSGLQIQCLLLMSRSMYNIGGDMVWISAGSIMRAAISMGFHRDPKYYPRIPILQGEVRRRLWASIMEINLTMSLDAGMSPLISFDDYDTEPPLNVNDEELNDSTTDLPIPKPNNVFTQTSIQLAVVRSFRVRLEVITAINDFRYELSYEDMIGLSTQLLRMYKENHKLVCEASQNSTSGQLQPTPLHCKLLDLTTQRYLMVLHRPFAMKARTDPKFYYSRKIYLDTAISVLTHPDPKVAASPIPDETELQDDYHRLRVLSGGFLKEIIIHAAIVVYLELIVPLEEDPDMTFTQQLKPSREPYRRLLKETIEINRQRLALGGETNVKGHLFMSAALGHVDAIEAGRPSEEGILEAARKSAQECYEALRARLPSTPNMNTLDQPEFDPAGGSNSDGTTLDMQGNDVDYTMADWGMDFENIPDSWMYSGWDEEIPGVRTTLG